MGRTKRIVYYGKRPADATPEKALELQAMGLTQTEIARRWHISRQWVSELIARAKRRQNSKLNPEP